MKKIARFFVLACMFLVSCTGEVLEDAEHIIDDIDEALSPGESYTLTVRSAESGDTVDNGELLWTTTDVGVASVSGDGVITVNGAGMCEIIARSKENLSSYSSIEVFSAYETVDATVESLTRLDPKKDPLGHYTMAENILKRYGKTAISVAQGDVASVVFDLIIESLSRDIYWYSATELNCRVGDGVVYTVTDWTSSAVGFDINKMDASNVHNSVKHVFSENVEQGVAMNEVLDAIRTSVSYQLPNDGIYHLDKMDPTLEYRVVVRGDYTACIVREHYSNGALTQIGDSISDIINWKLSDLVSRYAYTVVRGEIIDLENLRICIEVRSKK